ncbi:MAG: ligase-associated DNA damage response DEXH box helicase [Lewinellaceae bacterium]|nr:ligase-associated DNA damage response DEXH box helicase [Saprospiraceae bacterium]MCB9312650.1 ligase-associated DNA damage response DEXH box helicase [Lewinellaceae bacterium]
MADAITWFEDQGWFPFPFQLEAWEAWLHGESGLVNAPTGSGKTYSLIIPALLEAREKPEPKKRWGPYLLWITPLRALSREIHYSAQRAAAGLGLDWDIAIRTGDTQTTERDRQKKNPPHILITTPESLHILLAQKQSARYFSNLLGIVADEWHELVGSKRGVQVELGFSRLRSLCPGLKTWGISATIGNLEEAIGVLMGTRPGAPHGARLVVADQVKDIELISILPESIDELPWAGHLGIRLIEKVVPLLENSPSTLIFTNTRSQCEIWYQRLLDVAPDLAGQMAMHHGSISRELRDWVEEALHEGKLKAVVCTSSLDLGVDFRPVEQIIQIGSPKGVARFMQRAGRSGHQPGKTSRIYFVPTHALELIEAAALRGAILTGEVESRFPYIRSFDVLVQYLMTLAVGDGFYPAEILAEIRNTFSYESVSDAEWAWLIDFLTRGGSMESYDEFHKITVKPDGRHMVIDRRNALRHRLSIGTIVGDTAMVIKYVSGKRLGTIEEGFISALKPGDIFWFAGQSLELVRIRDMEVQVRKSNRRTGKIPSWQGGRMPLTSNLTKLLRDKLNEYRDGIGPDAETQVLRPLLERQMATSLIPSHDDFLIEYFHSKEGHHLVFYPFEGRFVHEGMAALIGWRLSRLKPISFSMAMNDYGFELLSTEEIPFAELTNRELYTTENLMEDIRRSINEAEMGRRRFRDIASISGMIFKGFPGRQKKDRHLQSSSSLLFDVFADYDPDNLLYLQAFEEVHIFQLEESRLREALHRIHGQTIRVMTPGQFTPFAFPIIVDSLSRERMSSESMEDRIRKMALSGF